MGCNEYDVLFVLLFFVLTIYVLLDRGWTGPSIIILFPSPLSIQTTPILLLLFLLRRLLEWRNGVASVEVRLKP